jgi:hypothetical protein
MAAANLGDLVATTLRQVNKNIADNVTNDNSFFRRLNEKGNIKKSVSGGREIDESIMYGTNSSVQFYDGYDTFTPPTDQNVVDLATYNWKQLGGFISISGKESMMNRGPEQRFDFVETRTKQLIANMQNTFSTSLYSDGTGSAGKELGGLKLLIADDPTAAGTIGGINQVTNTFWQNSYSAAAATTNANINSRMNSMWLSTKRGRDNTDMILADSYMYQLYWESLQALQRFSNDGFGDRGGGELKYKSADVVYDDQCPSKHMYFANTDYLFFKYAEGRWFDVGKNRTIQNADYDVVPVFVMGNLTCGNRKRQGVIIAS